MGIPMIMIAWPVFWLALIPIVFIERLVIKNKLLDYSYKRLTYVIFLGNLVATLFGIPFAWICMTLAEIILSSVITLEYLPRFLAVALESPWLQPHGVSVEPSIVIIPFLVLLIPFFFASYWFKLGVFLSMLNPEKDKHTIFKNAIFTANIYSYVLIVIIFGIYYNLSFSVVDGMVMFIHGLIR